MHHWNWSNDSLIHLVRGTSSKKAAESQDLPNGTWLTTAMCNIADTWAEEVKNLKTKMDVCQPSTHLNTDEEGEEENQRPCPSMKEERRVVSTTASSLRVKTPEYSCVLNVC